MKPQRTHFLLDKAVEISKDPEKVLAYAILALITQALFFFAWDGSELDGYLVGAQFFAVVFLMAFVPISRQHAEEQRVVRRRITLEEKDQVGGFLTLMYVPAALCMLFAAAMSAVILAVNILRLAWMIVASLL